MKESKNQKKRVLMFSAMALMLAMLFGLFVQGFSITSYAATGTITKNSVNIRKEPSTSSDVVGSAVYGNTVTVNSKTTGADGYDWYQVVVDANTVGYIRSDLINVTGDIPDENGGTTTPGTTSPSVTVTPVQPISAEVTGNEAVRVRSDAVIAADNITAQLASGTTVTVTGQAVDSEGNTWYLVSFDDNGTSQEGFIRADYLVLSGEVVPVDENTPQDPSTGDPSNSGQNDPNVTSQDYYVAWAAGMDGVERWYLFDPKAVNENGSLGKKYKVEEMIRLANEYDKDVTALKATVRTQKIVIVVLVILLLAAAFGVVLLFLKLKDMADEAYFSAVEKETVRERNAARGERGKDVPSSGKRQTQAAGANGQRPAQNKPAQQGGQTRSASGVPIRSSSQGSQVKSASQSGVTTRPAQNGTQARQTQGSTARPAQNSMQARQPQGGTARPVQNGTQAGAGQSSTQTRTSSDRSQNSTTGTAKTVTNQMSGSQQAQARPTQTPSRPAGQNVDTRSKKVTNDEDDFEFEFLNWDGEENS